MKVSEDTLSELTRVARNVKENASNPYSEYSVGAALLTSEGDIFKGCNIENATFTLTIHAEQNALTNALSNGVQEFDALLISTELEKGEPPCGVCRQTLSEFCSDEFPIYSVKGNNDEVQYNEWTLGELFPEAFRVFEVE